MEIRNSLITKSAPFLAIYANLSVNISTCSLSHLSEINFPVEKTWLHFYHSQMVINRIPFDKKSFIIRLCELKPFGLHSELYLRYAHIGESVRHVIDFVPLHIQIVVI